jgi:hypothetical protein
MIGALIAELEQQDPDVDWKQRAREIAGCPGDKLPGTIAAALIESFEDELEEFAA